MPKKPEYIVWKLPPVEGTMFVPDLILYNIEWNYKVDSRFSSPVQQFRIINERTLHGLIHGSVRWFVIAKKESSEYSTGISQCAGCIGHGSGVQFYFNKDMVPVPSGLWMDRWEPDHGITMDEYSSLPIEDRAAVEAVLQAKLQYAETQYEGSWLEFYLPRLFEEFWWSVGGHLCIYDELKFRHRIKKIFDENYHKVFW